MVVPSREIYFRSWNQFAKDFSFFTLLMYCIFCSFALLHLFIYANSIYSAWIQMPVHNCQVVWLEKIILSEFDNYCLKKCLKEKILVSSYSQRGCGLQINKIISAHGHCEIIHPDESESWLFLLRFCTPAKHTAFRKSLHRYLRTSQGLGFR